MSVNMKQSGALVPIASLTKAIIPFGVASCYSTEERQVGTWINGKPIYQKTFDIGTEATINYGSWTNLNIIITNVKHIIGAFGVKENNGAYFPLIALPDNDNINLQAARVSNASARYVTLLYTKTTDTAGSAPWLPSGEKAHHYSLTEQVVGTWVDGSTLYEKTFSYSSVSSGDNIFAFDLPTGAIVVDQKNAFFSLSQDMYFSDNNVSGNSISLINTNKDRTVINIAGVLAPYIDDVKITVKYIKTS